MNLANLRSKKLRLMRHDLGGSARQVIFDEELGEFDQLMEDDEATPAEAAFMEGYYDDS